MTRNELLEMIDEGMFDTKWLACALAGWLDNDDIARFCRANDILSYDELAEAIEE